MFLYHADGRTEESSLWGDGPISVGDYCRLPEHADHWWRVASVRWGFPPGSDGVAELEPSELPPHLAKLDAA